jgi:cytoskeleton protein RodZ
VFVRGHLRRYAALLGLPGDEIVGAYDRSRAQLAQPTLVPKSRAEMAPVRGRAKWPWLVGGALAFLAAAGIAAYLGAYGLHLPGAAAARGTEAEVATTVADASTSAGGSQAAPGRAGGATPVAAVPPGEGAAAAVPAGQVGLVFDYAADSWTEVYDGSGRTVLYDLGKAGTRRAVAGVAPFSITLGNAPAVSLSVNGRRVTMPAPPAGDTVTRFGLGADGTPR